MENVVSSNIEISMDHIYLWPDSVDVYQPRYANEERTRIKGLARFADGRVQELESAVDDRSSAFTRDVFAQYSVAEIEMFTHRENCQRSHRSELEGRVREDREASERREATFQAKARAFEIPEIRDSENAHALKKIRQARSAIEVSAWAAALLAQKI